MLLVPRSMTYKYHLRSGSESKSKNEIDINQNLCPFDSIIGLNLRIITPLLYRLYISMYNKYQYIQNTDKKCTKN